MPLKGQARTEYMREYMRRRRAAGKPDPEVAYRGGLKAAEWEIHVDDEGEGYVAAYEEPYGLYVHQMGDAFWWYVLNDNPDDDDNAIDVAEGEAASLVAAMAAAERAMEQTT